MATITESTNDTISGWQRLLLLLKAFDEALDCDPVDRAVDHLNRKVSELEDTVRDLETRLATEKREIQ